MENIKKTGNKANEEKQENNGKTKKNSNALMPTLYIPHGGGPCFFMEWTMGPPDTWQKMENWLAAIKNTLPEKPSAIVIVSGHWEEAKFTVYRHKQPGLFYDYYGFPEQTYRLQYPAEGSPEIAGKIMDLLKENHIDVMAEENRGFDHGVFVPLKVMFPDADVPVVQLSLKTGLNPEVHTELGRALKPLRKDGILILGSGNSYHNLHAMMSGRDNDDSEVFDRWLDEAVTGDIEDRINSLNNWSKAPAARMAHPREEHLLPLMVVSGAAEESRGELVFKDKVMGSVISAYQFGP